MRHRRRRLSPALLLRVVVASGCDDGVITYCHLGELATFDGAARGYSGCASGTSEGGRTIAHCVL